MSNEQKIRSPGEFNDGIYRFSVRGKGIEFPCIVFAVWDV